MELEIKNVSHTYKNGKKALSEISTSLTPGVYGLLGPNGAGKSTLMNIITDNLRPTAGEVSLDGNVIWKNSFAIKRGKKTKRARSVIVWKQRSSRKRKTA